LGSHSIVVPPCLRTPKQYNLVLGSFPAFHTKTGNTRPAVSEDYCLPATVSGLSAATGSSSQRTVN
jgi:hypothetical protein